MKSLGATATAAIAAGGYRAAWAVRIALTDAVTVWKYTDWDESVTISAETYTSRAMRCATLPRWGNPALAEARIILPNADDGVATQLRAGYLQGAAVKVYELLSTGSGTAFEAVLYFEGIVEAAACEEDWAELSCGTSAPLWGILLPRVFSARCRWLTTTECVNVATCNKTYAACTTNAQTAKFGGFRHLPVAGTVVFFRDAQTTLNGGGQLPSPGSSIPLASNGAI